jgi:hypothetical protein
MDAGSEDSRPYKRVELEENNTHPQNNVKPITNSDDNMKEIEWLSQILQVHWTAGGFDPQLNLGACF